MAKKELRTEFVGFKITGAEKVILEELMEKLDRSQSSVIRVAIKELYRTIKEGK